MLENIDIDMVILENIDIDKAILQNIDIDKISNQVKFGISNRLTQPPYLELFQSRGGPVKAFLGGASLETFSGEAQLKKPPCNYHTILDVENLCNRTDRRVFLSGVSLPQDLWQRRQGSSPGR